MIITTGMKGEEKGEKLLRRTIWQGRSKSMEEETEEIAGNQSHEIYFQKH